jgi:predicted membrane-bound spermidine synthase
VSDSSSSKALPVATANPVPFWLAPAFFASGFAALIYQVVWQRVLFASFGINIEAVTIVVSSFLVGLGAGSLIGGRISTARDELLLRFFAIVEGSIGAYGLLSVRVFRWLAKFAADMTPFTSGLLSFVLILVPTMLMGVTLPLLVSFAVRQNHNVGESVGRLYFINTAGSALASLAAAAFMMGALGESKSVAVAATINIVVAATAFLLSLTRSSAS